ncbi:hypothetical protein PEBR_00836 [Penicillium brasilianum]|uniref:Uncharacterized protein n=1 Tax=Penicillium brasilianum TaxID=104259 RepID=A0A1S9S2Q0_PENBI|nr:hypothetical protein PEBR_00836 [Penicillium brasilianum]
MKSALLQARIPSFQAPKSSNGRVTIKEIRQLVIIAHQTTIIESTKGELLEVKHDQNVFRDQNKKLYDEPKTLRE